MVVCCFCRTCPECGAEGTSFSHAPASWRPSTVSGVGASRNYVGSYTCVVVSVFSVKVKPVALLVIIIIACSDLACWHSG